MAKRHEKWKHRIGLAPGSLIHLGERRTEQPRMTIFDYNQGDLVERTLESIEECIPFRERPDTVTWLNIDGLHDIGLVEQIGRIFEIHSLVLEDVLNTNQRPKFEDYGRYLFIIFKMIHHEETDVRRVAEQLSMLIGQGYVVTFQERPGDVFEQLRERLRNGNVRIRTLGPGYLAYALLDCVVDSYFPLLEELDQRIDQIEEQLLTEVDVLEPLHRVKRELLFLRRHVTPVREIVRSISRSESELFGPSVADYLRDLYDHGLQVSELLETMRETATSTMDFYLSSVGNRMNAVMKVLTVIATLFIPLTFLAGIYGMNFDNMPELHWAYGYPILLAVMVVVAVVMVVFFKRRNLI